MDSIVAIEEDVNPEDLQVHTHCFAHFTLLLNILCIYIHLFNKLNNNS